MIEFKTGKNPQQNAMRMQRALGRTCRTGSVNNQGRIISARLNRLEIRAAFLDTPPKIQNPGQPVRVDHQNELERRQALLDFQNLR